MLEHRIKSIIDYQGVKNVSPSSDLHPYISETQGGKSSTGEQESDCQTLAKQKELQVVHVYREVEKYRVRNRLVEPSGSRSDRPALRAMLKAAARDSFDVILAWREDRLCRGIRAMLTVLETVHDYKIEILLAKEYESVQKNGLKSGDEKVPALPSKNPPKQGRDYKRRLATVSLYAL